MGFFLVPIIPGSAYSNAYVFMACPVMAQPSVLAIPWNVIENSAMKSIKHRFLGVGGMQNAYQERKKSFGCNFHLKQHQGQLTPHYKKIIFPLLQKDFSRSNKYMPPPRWPTWPTQKAGSLGFWQLFSWPVCCSPGKTVGTYDKLLMIQCTQGICHTFRHYLWTVFWVRQGTQLRWFILLFIWNKVDW